MILKTALSWLTILHIKSTTTSGFGFSGHNSPPVFDFKREWLVPENEPIGSRIITVSTRDEDKDSIEYGIEPAMFLDGSNYFTINPRNGDVFLKESLLKQAGNDYYLFITANDGHQTAKIEVYVRVIDSDRNSGAISTNAGSFNFPFNRSYPGLPIRRPFPPYINAQLPPSRSKDAVSVNTEPRKPTATTTTTANTILPPKSTNTPTTSTTTTRPADTTHQSVPTIQTSVPTTPYNKSDDKLNDSTRGSADRNSDGLDMITAFLPLLAAVCFAPIAGLVFWVLHHRCQSKHNRNLMKSFSHKIVNLDKSGSSETSVSSVSGELDYNGALFQQIRAKRALNGKTESNKYTSSLNIMKGEEKVWEFPRHHLRFIGILGEGCFGQVWKCEALDISKTDLLAHDIVAVKTLKENAAEKEKKDLLSELEVMKLLDPHPNVVTLLGSCTERDPVFLIMEFVPYGKLQSYLRESRAERYYGNLHGSSRLTARDLTSFAYQVAKGMEYLSSKGIIHRDLAARNILIGTNKTCKVADFGFARDVIASHVYERKSEGRLPIRWMAIESLIDSIFTVKSDVWSFGILMWEIVTLGSTPYPGLAAAEVMKKVRDGYRLEKPEHCKREMYNIMYYCWDTDPNQRPTFNELVNLLDKLLISENDYIELDRFPDHSYYNIVANLSGEKL